MKTAIERIVYQNGPSTNTARALEVMGTEMFTERHGDRPDVKNVAVVITDGKSNNRGATIRAANAARQANIHIYAIGIGKTDRVMKQVSAELDGIASQPIEDNKFAVTEFSQLANLTDLLFVGFCEGEMCDYFLYHIMHTLFKSSCFEDF